MVFKLVNSTKMIFDYYNHPNTCNLLTGPSCTTDLLLLCFITFFFTSIITFIHIKRKKKKKKEAVWGVHNIKTCMIL